MTRKQCMTEQLKANDQIAWIGNMNNTQNTAIEIVNQDRLYI